MKQPPVQEFREMVQMGTAGLVHAFSLCIEEMFREPLVVSLTDNGNPYAKLPTHVKSSIIQSAAAKCFAQSLAALALIGEASGGVDAKQVLSMGKVVLKHEFDLYCAGMRKVYVDNKNSMGKGSEGGPVGDGHVLDPSTEGSEDEAGGPVHNHQHCGQDGHD